MFWVWHKGWASFDFGLAKKIVFVCCPTCIAFDKWEPNQPGLESSAAGSCLVTKFGNRSQSACWRAVRLSDNMLEFGCGPKKSTGRAGGVQRDDQIWTGWGQFSEVKQFVGADDLFADRRFSGR
jgi:hypothetical protein